MTDFPLQFGGKLRALLRVGVEERLQFTILNAFGGGAESVLAVLAGFD